MSEVGPSGYGYNETYEEIQFDLYDPNDDAALEQLRAYLDLGWGILDMFEVVEEFKDGNLGGEAGIGTLDHRDLEHTDSDDHLQYHTNARGDVRYYTKAGADTAAAAQITTALAALTAASVAETATRKWLTDTERTKLTNIATGATANQTDAQLHDLGNATGTLNADLIADSVGTSSTSGRKFTKALKDKVDGFGSSLVAQSTYDAHVANILGTAHTSTGVSVPARVNVDYIYDIPPLSFADPVANFAGGTQADFNEAVADYAYAQGVVQDAHQDSLQAHSMPAPGNRLVYRDADGVIPIAVAASPPASGEKPPAGVYWLYNDTGDILTILDHSGNKTVLGPPWADEYVSLGADVTKTSSTALATLLQPANDLPVGEYLIDIWLTYTAAGNNLGGLKLGWSGYQSDDSIDWTLEGIAPGATSSSASHFWGHGAKGAALSIGGADATRIGCRVSGRIKITTTAGKPTLTYAQSVSNATGTVVKANSYMYLRKVA